jgi:hypothetical protein
VRLAEIVFLPLSLLAPMARADLCPAPPGSLALGSEDSEVRLSFLLRAMDEDSRHLATWSLVWGSAYATALAGQLTAIPLVQGGIRVDLSAGAIAAAVGSASLYLLPLRITGRAHFEPQVLEDSDRCKVLAQVEQRFFEAAQIDRLSGGWIAHAGNLAINAALALVLGLGYGRWTSAGISAAVGLAVGEANLWTQPHGFIADQARYLELGTHRDVDRGGSWVMIPIATRSFAGAAIAFQL